MGPTRALEEEVMDVGRHVLHDEAYLLVDQVTDDVVEVDDEWVGTTAARGFEEARLVEHHSVATVGHAMALHGNGLACGMP